MGKVTASFILHLNDDGSVTHSAFEMPNDDGTAEAVKVVQDAMPGSTVVDAIADLIRSAESAEQLNRVWQDNKKDWTSEHSKLASVRKKEIA